MMTRRAFGAMGIAGLVAPRAFAQTAIGDFTLTSVSDGNLVLPANMILGGLEADALAAVQAEFGLGDTLTPPCNVTLLQAGDRNVLFDVGAGPEFMSSAGFLLDALDAQGLAPEDITDVVFTHGHPDHLWGLLDDFDDLLFSDAAYMIGQTEWDYWTDPATVDSIGADRTTFAVGAARRLDRIADRVTFIGDGAEILPGVAAHATFGHTPGHMAFEVRQGADAVMILGDCIGNHHAAFRFPAMPSGSDQDQTAAAATRVALLDRLASEQMTVLGFHLPGNGLGRVERDGDAYRFVQEG